MMRMKLSALVSLCSIRMVGFFWRIILVHTLFVPQGYFSKENEKTQGED